MKKDLKFLLIAVVGIIVLVAVAGMYKFNVLGDDVHYEDDVEELGEFDDYIVEKSDDTFDILVGTWRWVRTEMNSDEGINPQPSSDDFSITFNEDGSFSGTTDCNNFGGNSFVVQDRRIGWGPMFSTKMYCEGSQEQEFINLISETQSYHWDDEQHVDMLYFMLPYDSGALVFTKIREDHEDL